MSGIPASPDRLGTHCRRFKPDSAGGFTGGQRFFPVHQFEFSGLSRQLWAAVPAACCTASSAIAQLLTWVQTYSVEYRGVRYTIRARIERQQWSVAIHPAGVEMTSRIVNGSRWEAELKARALIDSWLKNTPHKVLRASSFVSSLAADRRPGSSSK